MRSLTVLVNFAVLAAAVISVVHALPQFFGDRARERLARLRVKLSEVQCDFPQAEDHKEVLELEKVLLQCYEETPLPLHLSVAGYLTMNRERHRGEIPDLMPDFVGLAEECRVELQHIEFQAVREVTRAALLGQPLWFITGWCWLAVRGRFSAKDEPLIAATEPDRRRAEAATLTAIHFSRFALMTGSGRLRLG